MDWKDFFRITILKETLNGQELYFQTDLEIPTHFSMEEIAKDEFEYLNLSEFEKKHLSLALRKIILRHHYFKGPEFVRILENFIRLVEQDKDQFLTFSTQGGGVNLFLALQKVRPELLKEKKLICYTSERPLKIMGRSASENPGALIITRHSQKGYFSKLSSLWT